MKDKLKQGVGSATVFLLLMAVLLVLNLISVNLFARLDLTEGKVYSLSKTSKEVIRNLNDPLIIRMYITRELPPPYNGYIRYLKDQLEEYQVYSGGKLKLELIHPDNPEKELEAQRAGIPPLQVNALQNDKIEIKKVYMGMVFLFEDRKEVIPVIQSVTDLEYEITSTIRRISHKIIPMIGFLIGKDGLDLDTDMIILNKELNRHYQVRKINLDEGDRISAKVATLIIPGAKKKFSEWERYGIDQFLMKGGRVAFLLNQVYVDLENGNVTKQNLEIEDFLANYGVKVNHDLIIDWQCSQISVTQTQKGYPVSNIINYPFFPMVTRFDRSNTIVKDLESVNFNFVSSLDTAAEESSKNLRFNPIVWSSDITGIKTEPFDINPYKQFTREDFNYGPQILAATVQGSFKSYYADWDEAQIEERIGFVDTTRTQSPETRLVVVGDADFINDQNLRGNDNLTFFLNIVDGLIQEESLITIRSKQVTTRPLKEISNAARKLIKYGNILGLPILVIVFGVVRWQLKKKIRPKEEQTQEPVKQNKK